MSAQSSRPRCIFCAAMKPTACKFIFSAARCFQRALEDVLNTRRVSSSSPIWCGTIPWRLPRAYLPWSHLPFRFALVLVPLLERADLGVSVWGKDFNPEAHAEIVRQGEEAEYLPTVDIYLPVCNEPLVLLANTWNYVHALDYPRATVHVLDDGAKDEVRDLAAEYGFKCERMMYKSTHHLESHG